MTALAINGGPPVRTAPWPHYPTYSQAEKGAACRVIDSGWLCAHHRGEPGEVEALEAAFADWVGTTHALGVGNGTEGLHLALMAAGIGVNDEVIVPTLTFMVTATSVMMQNAVPVFADSEPETMGLDPTDVEAKISARTRAIIPVHLCGYPAKMDELMALARRHDLIVIEDCSHAHGSVYKGRQVGAVGDIGVFSLQHKKCLSTGDGGLVTTDDDGYAAAVRKFRSFGHRELSYNYRMTEVAAAIGRIRLQLLGEHNRVRQANARRLDESLRGLKGIHVRQPSAETESVYYSLLLEFDPAQFADVTRDDVVAAVRAEGVPLAPSYKPVHRLPSFHPGDEMPARGCPWLWPLYDAPENERPSFDDGCCPLAEDYSDHRLMELKIHPPVGEKDLLQVADAIRKVVEHLG